MDPNNKTYISSALLQEPPTSQNDIPRNENSISLEIQRPITTEKNSASTKLGLCLPASQSENLSPKKRSKSSRRCRFSGCTILKQAVAKLYKRRVSFTTTRLGLRITIREKYCIRRVLQLRIPSRLCSTFLHHHDSYLFIRIYHFIPTFYCMPVK